MNSNTNNTQGSNINNGNTSNMIIKVSCGSAKSCKRTPKVKGNSKKTLKVLVIKYRNGKIPPKLVMVRKFVEAQPTSELQSQLFTITESNLTH